MWGSNGTCKSDAINVAPTHVEMYYVGVRFIEPGRRL